jgi:hypothetical protein
MSIDCYLELSTKSSYLLRKSFPLYRPPVLILAQDLIMSRSFWLTIPSRAITSLTLRFSCAIAPIAEPMVHWVRQVVTISNLLASSLEQLSIIINYRVSS